MTETTHPQPTTSPYRGASTNATVAVADVRRREWGSRTLPTLVRDFTRAALRKPAVADYVREHIFDTTSGGKPPAAVGDALRLALDEVLAATTSEDWAQVASDLLAHARECIEDEESTPAPMAEGWAPPPGAMRRPTGRKQPVRVELSEILAWLTERRSATTRDIAQHFNISEHTAWEKANALVHQGKLAFTPGEVGWGGHPRVYSIPATPEPASGPSGPPASSAPSTASVVVTFKDEGRGDGSVVVIRVAPTPEVTAAIAAGVPFAYDPSDATDLGWMSRQQAITVAALHGVELAEW
jgi:hypothetical protein